MEYKCKDNRNLFNDSEYEKSIDELPQVELHVLDIFVNVAAVIVVIVFLITRSYL